METGNGHVSANSKFTTTADDSQPPMVQSVTRADGSPTNAATVSWTVTFSEAVTGVGVGDFALVTAPGSVTAAAISAVTGTGSQYSVTVSTGSGSGTLGLNVDDDDSIVDAAGIRWAALGWGMAASRQVRTTRSIRRRRHQVDQAADQVDPASASPISFTVVFR